MRIHGRDHPSDSRISIPARAPWHDPGTHEADLAEILEFLAQVIPNIKKITHFCSTYILSSVISALI